MANSSSSNFLNSLATNKPIVGDDLADVGPCDAACSEEAVAKKLYPMIQSTTAADVVHSAHPSGKMENDDC